MRTAAAATRAREHHRAARLRPDGAPARWLHHAFRHCERMPQAAPFPRSCSRRAVWARNHGVPTAGVSLVSPVRPSAGLHPQADDDARGRARGGRLGRDCHLPPWATTLTTSEPRGGRPHLLLSQHISVRRRRRVVARARLIHFDRPSPPAPPTLAGRLGDGPPPQYAYVYSSSQSSPMTQRKAESLPLTMPHSKSSQGPRLARPYLLSTLRAELRAPFQMSARISSFGIGR
jgi:hypothetical protein